MANVLQVIGLNTVTPQLEAGQTSNLDTYSMVSPLTIDPSGTAGYSGTNALTVTGNVSANALYQGTTNQAATTSIQLTASSVTSWIITGSGGQTIILPDATTLPVGAMFTFNNNQSSGAITVNVFGSGSAPATVQSGGYATVTLLTKSVAAGTWDVHYGTPSNVTWSTNTFNYPGTITGATWNGVAVPVLYGGTGTTTATGTAGSVVLSNTPTLVTPVLGAATGTSLALGTAAGLTLSSTTTGLAPSINATGTDTNIPIALQSKGTGGIDLTAGANGLSLTYGTVVSGLQRVAVGSGYTSAPTVAISAPNLPSGVQATATVPISVVVTPTVSNTGTSGTYNTGDVLTVSGGTFTTAATITITASGGLVTGVSAFTAGAYTVYPGASPVATTSIGTGVGATFTLVFGISNVFTITAAGSGYVEQPTVTLSSGGGSGASVIAQLGTASGTNTTAVIRTPNQSNTNEAIQFRGPFGNSTGIPMLSLRDISSADSYLRIQNGIAFANIYPIGNANAVLGIYANGTGQILLGTGGASQYTQLRINNIVSPVNYVTIQGSTTANAPAVGVAGTDTNVSLNLVTKGTGTLQINGTAWQKTKTTLFSYTGSAQTYTMATGCVAVSILAVGGGGGGGFGGTYTPTTGGSGGAGAGAGGVSYILYRASDISASSPFTVTIGAGGSGGTSGTLTGGQGGVTSVGSIAYGGGAGGGYQGTAGTLSGGGGGGYGTSNQASSGTNSAGGSTPFGLVGSIGAAPGGSSGSIYTPSAGGGTSATGSAQAGGGGGPNSSGGGAGGGYNATTATAGAASGNAISNFTNAASSGGSAGGAGTGTDGTAGITPSIVRAGINYIGGGGGGGGAGNTAGGVGGAGGLGGGGAGGGASTTAGGNGGAGGNGFVYIVEYF